MVALAVDVAVATLASAAIIPLSGYRNSAPQLDTTSATTINSQIIFLIMNSIDLLTVVNQTIQYA